MLLFVTAVKLLAEIAWMALLGRWVLAAWLHRLHPSGQAQNVFVWVLDTLCRPVLAAVGWVAPRWVPRAYLPVLAWAGLSGVWLAATLTKIVWCLELGVQACR